MNGSRTETIVVKSWTRVHIYQRHGDVFGKASWVCSLGTLERCSCGSLKTIPAPVDASESFEAVEAQSRLSELFRSLISRSMTFEVEAEKRLIIHGEPGDPARESIKVYPDGEVETVGLDLSEPHEIRAVVEAAKSLALLRSEADE